MQPAALLTASVCSRADSVPVEQHRLYLRGREMDNISLLYTHAIHQPSWQDDVIDWSLHHVKGGEKSGAAETGVLKTKARTIDNRLFQVPAAQTTYMQTLDCMPCETASPRGRCGRVIESARR